MWRFPSRISHFSTENRCLPARSARKVIETLGARATMIEWDQNVPPLDELLRELDRAGHWARLALDRLEVPHAA